MKMIMTVIFVFISFGLFAQHSEQPEKESHTDLRNQSVLFGLESLADKTSYTLERTVGRDYFLRRKTKRKDELHKTASHRAQQLDREFSSLFLKIMYEIPEVDGKCEILFQLVLRGESQKICKKDDKKTQVIKQMQETLSDLF